MNQIVAAQLACAETVDKKNQEFKDLLNVNEGIKKRLK